MASKNEYSGYRKSVGRIMVPGQGIYEDSSTAKAALGDRIAFADGRVFRYAKAGATALAAGKLVKAGALVAQINRIIDAAVAVGHNVLTFQTTQAHTTLTDGYLQLNTGTGLGMQYKIRSSGANATTSTYTNVTLYDDISVAVDATTYGSLFYNPYEQCEICSTMNDIVLGVPPVAVTAEYYFWCQTWGPACVLSEGTATAGRAVYISTNSSPAGVTDISSVTAGTTIYAHSIGRMWQTGVDTHYKMVFLMIAP